MEVDSPAPMVELLAACAARRMPVLSTAATEALAPIEHASAAVGVASAAVNVALAAG